MNSLDKNMYFLPNRYFVDGSRMYVSFNIAVIPTDMKVTDMTLHVPIKADSPNVIVFAHSIQTGWDEGLMTSGYRPPLHHPFTQSLQNVNNGEITLSVSSFADAWRFDSFNNHGICVICKQGTFDVDSPPNLIVGTL